MGRVKKGTEKKDSKKDAKKAEKGPKKNGEKVDGGTNFRRSGAKGGTAKSTLSGYQSALYHFNAFLEVKGLPCFDDLSEQELCCIELFQEYGTYLSEFARKKRKDELLSLGSAKQFLSGPKAQAQEKFPTASIWMDRAKLNNFLSRLFRSSDCNIVSSKLRPFAYVMFASLLQYLQPMIDKYTVKHIVIKHLYDAASEFKIKKKTLLRWGHEIDADWRARNMMNIANPADLAPVVTKLQKELLHVKAQNVELKHMLTELRENQISSARDTSEKLAQLLAIVTLQDTPISSIGATRMRHDSTYLPSAAAADVPLNSSGSESAVLILSPTEGNAFSVLQQPKDLVILEASSSLSLIIQKWYEKGFKVNDKPAQWSASPRDKHCIVKVISFLETVWPTDVCEVLRAGPPAPSSPDYLQWNTARVAAANRAVDAVVAAIAAVDKTKMHDKRTVNAVYGKLHKNKLVSTK